MRANKTLISVLIAAALLLIGLRIALPWLITREANAALDRLPGYGGSVGDVDLALIRGAYTLHDVSISKEKEGSPQPFFSLDRADVSLEWRELLRGKISAEVLLIRPQANFVVDKDKEVQDGRGVNWLDQLEEMSPIRINRFEIREGAVHFRDYSTQPRVHVFLEDLFLQVRDISNVSAGDTALPSSLELRGRTVGGGRVSASGRFNALREVPDFLAHFRLEEARLTALNDFLKAYAKVSAEAGTFSFYAEAALNDGNLQGYVRPFLTDVALVDWTDKDASLARKIWETMVGAVKTILENPETGSVGAHVPFEGRFSGPDVELWTGVWTLLRNAFVEALSQELDFTIEFEGGNP